MLRADSTTSIEQFTMVTNCSMYVFSTSWILDSGVGAHVCIINLDDIERSRKLGEREVIINMGSGHYVVQPT